MASAGGLRQRMGQGLMLDTLAESPTKEPNRPDKPRLTKWSTWSAPGIAVYTLFLAATAFYFHVRLSTTLDLAEYFWYGVAILGCEAVGASAVMLYGLTIIRCMPPEYVQQQIKPAEPGEGYDLQVLVPCYTEDLKIVAETVSAAVEADMPPDSTCTVWLLDDGNDPNKRAWVEGLGDECVRYITGRKRPSDEVNGKAGNVNHAMSVIYADRAKGSLSQRDVLAIFDCDQVCAPEFFVESLPLLNGSPEVGMVLTPQQFRKVDDDNDIFNHSNRHFWEVMIPGMSAWGMVVCTGSNLLVRSAVVQAVGGFPGKTITEDYMLGLELAKAGFQSRYLQKYMALGEAPEEGAIFRQRSRWCKGHMQALMSSENPLLQPRLSPLLRVLYTAGTWSYICAALTSPAFTLVPLVAVVWGVSPLSLNPQFAVAFPIYIASMHAVVYFCSSWSLLRALWFGSCSNQILWYTYLKAIVNTVLWAAGLKRKGRFKTTIKTGDMLLGTPRTPRTPKTPKTPAVPFAEKLSAALAANQDGAHVRHDAHVQQGPSSQPESGAATPPQGDQARKGHVSFEGNREPEPKSVHASPGKSRFAEIQVDATQGAEAQTADEAGHNSKLGADERPQPPKSPYETIAPVPGNLQRVKTGAAGSLLESMASLSHGSFSLSRGTSLARAGSALLRSSSMARQMTVPELQREVSLHGRRPSWNLQAAQAPSSTKQPPKGAAGDDAAAAAAASPQVGLGKVKVLAISFGQIRDLWVPMLVLGTSLFTAAAAGYQVLTSPSWGVFSGLPGMVTLLWALYNCIGPYLLLHYTYLGRQDSLRIAASVGMHAALALAVLAVALLVVFSPTSHDLAHVLDSSYRFFEAQRSGKLPADNRVPWRGDSALADIAPNGASLAGGWYDAGDHLKTSFSMGLALSFLSWGAIAFPQGHEMSGQLVNARSSVQWAAEYLIKCHISKHQFVGQVGNMELDHDFWGRPEDMEAAGVVRPAYMVNATHPGSDMAGMTAAGLASASLALKSSNPKLAKAALKHAKQLWDFGARYPGSFTQSVPEIGAVYPSSAWRDDMAWGAAWLHMATGKRWYRKQALQYLQDSRKHEPSRWQYYVTNWDNMVWATQALLATGPAQHADSAAAMEEYLGKWRKGQVVNYTRQGLAWSDQWGTLRNTGNVAMLALIHAQSLPSRQARPHQCWALSQLRYMIGEGPRSFVVGYGRNAPQRPHHRAASCPPAPQACNHSALEAPGANPFQLTGALVGGPTLQDSYSDDRSDYVTAEVGIEYSAGFTAALAGALQMRTSWAVCQQGRVMQ